MNGTAPQYSAVSTKFNVSTADVLSANPSLTSDCNIAAPKTLCLPQACALYTIRANDTCDSVAANATKIDVLQLDGPGNTKKIDSLDISGPTKAAGVNISASIPTLVLNQFLTSAYTDPNNLQGMAVFVRQ